MDFAKFKGVLKQTFNGWDHYEGVTSYRFEQLGEQIIFNNEGTITHRKNGKTKRITISNNGIAIDSIDEHFINLSADLAQAYIEMISGGGDNSLRNEILHLTEMYRQGEPIAKLLTELEEKVK